MKNKDIEMKIYELLGIKQFKKVLMKTIDPLINSLSSTLTKIFKVDKTKVKKELNASQDNYHIEKKVNLDNLRNFKKQLWFNASVHTIGILICIPSVISTINGVTSVGHIINTAICLLLNSYCIMLQRYNYIRIDKVIKRFSKKEEKDKEQVKEQIKEMDDSLEKHIYKKNSIFKNKSITLEEFLNTATLSELKTYKENLEKEQILYNAKKMYPILDIECSKDIIVPYAKKKSLKLEFSKK